MQNDCCCKSVYEQSPKLIPVKATTPGSYNSAPPVIIVNSATISLAITAFDTHSGSSNLNGIYEAVLYIDEIPQIGFRMDKISYNDTRYLNAHIDYKTKATGGSFIQHLTELPGFLNSIYRRGASDGVIDLSDGDVHNIKIEVRDAYQNKSYLNSKIKWSGIVAAPASPDSRLPTPSSRLSLLE